MDRSQEEAPQVQRRATPRERPQRNVVQAHMAAINEEVSKDSVEEEEKEVTIVTAATDALLPDTAYLWRTKAKIRNPDNLNAWTEAVIFLDCGGQRSYITESLASQLKLQTYDTAKLKVSTFAEENPKTILTAVTAIAIKTVTYEFKQIIVRTVPAVTGQPVHVGTVQGEQLSQRPQILIGADSILQFIDVPVRKNIHGLRILDTLIGPIVVGNKIRPSVSTACTFSIIDCEGIQKQSDPLEKFWTLEMLGIRQEGEITADEEAKQHFERTVKQLPNGRISGKNKKRFRLRWVTHLAWRGADFAVHETICLKNPSF